MNQKTFDNGDSFTEKWITTIKNYRLKPACAKELDENTRSQVPCKEEDSRQHFPPYSTVYQNYMKNLVI